MMSRKNRLIGMSVVAAVAVAASSVWAGEEAKTPPAPAAGSEAAPDAANAEGHMMMDHSTGDSKAMMKMKDKKIPIHHAGDPPAASDSSTKPVDHMMMDHSTGDSKAMMKMKDKKIPIHHSGDASTGAVGDPAH